MAAGFAQQRKDLEEKKKGKQNDDNASVSESGKKNLFFFGPPAFLNVKNKKSYGRKEDGRAEAGVADELVLPFLPASSGHMTFGFFFCESRVPAFASESSHAREKKKRFEISKNPPPLGS